MIATQAHCTNLIGDAHCGEANRYCQAHDLTYCPSCNRRCSMCAAGDPPSPKHSCGMPMEWCDEHRTNWCPQCAEECPLCVRASKPHVCIADGFCHDHDNAFCTRCGCQDCKARSGTKCHYCGQLAIKRCKRHKKTKFCAVCDQECQKCRARRANRTQAEPRNDAHVLIRCSCARPLAKCQNDHRFCTACSGRACPYCKPKHKCGTEMERCEQHHTDYCPKCEVCAECWATHFPCEDCGKPQVPCDYHAVYHCPTCGGCPDCLEEKQRSGVYVHTCGAKLAYCRKHNVLVCPVCDEGSECEIVCCVGRHVNHTPSMNATGRETWAEFLVWKKERGRFLDALGDACERWKGLADHILDVFHGAFGYDCGADELAERLAQFERAMEIMQRTRDALTRNDPLPPDEFEDHPHHYQKGTRTPHYCQVTIEELPGTGFDKPPPLPSFLGDDPFSETGTELRVSDR